MNVWLTVTEGGVAFVGDATLAGVLYAIKDDAVRGASDGGDSPAPAVPSSGLP
jgi:hypothetical protein